MRLGLYLLSLSIHCRYFAPIVLLLSLLSAPGPWPWRWPCAWRAPLARGGWVNPCCMPPRARAWCGALWRACGALRGGGVASCVHEAVARRRGWGHRAAPAPVCCVPRVWRGGCMYACVWGKGQCCMRRPSTSAAAVSPALVWPPRWPRGVRDVLPRAGRGCVVCVRRWHGCCRAASGLGWLLTQCVSEEANGWDDARSYPPIHGAPSPRCPALVVLLFSQWEWAGQIRGR